MINLILGLPRFRKNKPFNQVNHGSDNDQNFFQNDLSQPAAKHRLQLSQHFRTGNWHCLRGVNFLMGGT